MTNREVLFWIYENTWTTLDRLHKGTGLSPGDSGVRLNHFWKYGWLSRFRKGKDQATGREVRIVKKGRILYIYNVTEKGKSYLRSKGYSV